MHSEIAEVRKTYPHQYKDVDCLWFSQIKDPHLGHETAYGYWIPGNSKDTLLAEFVFGERDEIADALRASLEVHWRRLHARDPETFWRSVESRSARAYELEKRANG